MKKIKLPDIPASGLYSFDYRISQSYLYGWINQKFL